MSVINLKFWNKSNDVSQSKVVIFQKQVNPDYNEDTIAWIVIQYCGKGDYHPFTYNTDLEVSASDSYGNYTPQLNASPGQQFEVKEAPSGHVLTYKGPGTNKDEVQVLNALSMGAINVYCYRSGKLLAQKLNVVPSEMAVFEFLPRIFIGVLTEVQEGEVMNSAVVSQVNTELSLLGLKSADIVMRGGGSGKEAVPFTFDLENLVMAEGAETSSHNGNESI
ncbi:MAG: hypothetical protein GTO45_29525 [Candidatus Aminicenantes bacterium]|nr:hypothetical protein [Candidatus Aminicenantes bacterium]NIM82935.1 hypothetical protein [Candidatus Aminicenantes bacterium]NIN22311.1 hypothetical protein [Candidatus Aminicenantes bacterium]NIN46079.1 hypothetical protein [Candidatus Aminicenantes bacterium]NIN88915.1 hypothetical protein [Candidatus Aminicenantes bacterium]